MDTAMVGCEVRLKIELSISTGKDATDENDGDNGTDPGDTTASSEYVGFDAGRYGRIEEVI